MLYIKCRSFWGDKLSDKEVPEHFFVRNLDARYFFGFYDYALNSIYIIRIDEDTEIELQPEDVLYLYAGIKICERKTGNDPFCLFRCILEISVQKLASVNMYIFITTNVF